MNKSYGKPGNCYKISYQKTRKMYALNQKDQTHEQKQSDRETDRV